MKDKSRNSVGYGRPPLHSQFKRGVSGNPAGRPRHDASLADDIVAELQKALAVDEYGEAVSKQQAIAEVLVAKALEGDHHAIAALVKLSSARRADGQQEQEAEDKSVLDDDALIAAYERRQQMLTNEEISGEDGPSEENGAAAQ